MIAAMAYADTGNSIQLEYVRSMLMCAHDQNDVPARQDFQDVIRIFQTIDPRVQKQHHRYPVTKRFQIRIEPSQIFGTDAALLDFIIVAVQSDKMNPLLLERIRFSPIFPNTIA